MNRRRILSSMCMVSIFCILFAGTRAQEAAPTHTITFQKVLQSLSGEDDKTEWEMSAGVELGRDFFTGASIGGKGIALRGTVAASQGDKFQVTANIAETTSRGTTTGSDGQTLKVADEREIQIKVLIALDQDMTASARPAIKDSEQRPVEAIVIRLEKAQTSKPSTPASNYEIPHNEWKINEEAPRKSGLRLLPGQKQPQYLIAYRTEQLEGAASQPLNMAPKVVVIGNKSGRIQIKGAKETIAIVSQVQKDNGGALDFRATLTRDMSDDAAAPGTESSAVETSKKVSEKLEREMTLKPGEEKEVGDFMGVKVLVTVTRVE